MKIELTTPPRFKILAFLMAVLIFSMPFVTLAQQNSVQAEAMAAAERDAETNVNTPLWFWGGCVGGVLVFIFSHIHEPSPPAASLLGKSPEYVALYTDAYKAKASQLQTSRAMWGCVTGTVISSIAYGLLIAAEAADELQ